MVKEISDQSNDQGKENQGIVHETEINPETELQNVNHKLAELISMITSLSSEEKEIMSQGKKVKEDVQFQAQLAMNVVKQSERKLIKQIDDVVKLKVELLQNQKSEAENALQQLKRCETLLKERIQGNTEIQDLKDVHLCKNIQPSSFHPIEKPDIVFNEAGLQKDIGHLKFCRYGKPVLKKGHLFVGRKSTTTLLIKNHEGKPFSISLSLISCILVNVNDNTTISCDIKEVNPGKFSITCIPTKIGKQHMIVRVGGIQITENTFTVSVTLAPEMRGNFVKETLLHAPYGLVTKKNGDVIVCEYGAHHLAILNKSTVATTTIGMIHREDGDDRFNCPTGVCLSSDGYIFVTDQHRVLKMTMNGQLIKSLGSLHEGDGPLQFRYPRDIVVHPTSGQVYVADTDNGRIQVLNNDLTFSHTFGNDGALIAPFSLAFDSELNLYIADCGGHCIFKVTGDHVTQISSYGKEPGKLDRPSCLVIDTDNLIFVTEEGNDRVSIFNTNGGFKHCFGKKGSGKVEFNQPMAIAVDSAGCLYVSDFYNNRLLVLN